MSVNADIIGAPLHPSEGLGGLELFDAGDVLYAFYAGTTSSNNISTLIIGALIFISVVAWTDALQVKFRQSYSQLPQTPKEQEDVSFRFYYALLITFVALLVILIIHLLFPNKPPSLIFTRNK